MARWAVPGGNGKVGFSIPQVPAWPPVRRRFAGRGVTRPARWAVPGRDGKEEFSIAKVPVWPPVRRAAALRWPRGDARMARWAVPGGDGKEGFAITQVPAWPPAERKTDAAFAGSFYALRGWGIFLPIPAGMGQHSRECVLRGVICSDIKTCRAANRSVFVTRPRGAGPHQRCGKVGFSIAHVAVWPLARRAAALRWPRGDAPKALDRPRWGRQGRMIKPQVTGFAAFCGPASLAAG